MTGHCRALIGAPKHRTRSEWHTTRPLVARRLRDSSVRRAGGMPALLLLVLLSPLPAFAGAAVSFSLPVSGGCGPNNVEGWQFQTTTAITVSALGVFDNATDGLSFATPVGLYDAGCTLLASTTIPAGTGAPLLNGYRYAGIAPVVLPAGQTFRVAAVMRCNDYTPQFNTLPEVSIDASLTGIHTRRIAFGSSLACPTSTTTIFSFAPNFLIGPACGNGIVQSGEQCDDGNAADGDCCSSACQIEAAESVCRAAAGACDLAETCDGVTTACPADAKSTAVCRPSVDSCDVAESCDGAADACPADVTLPDGAACDDGDACTQTDVCQDAICQGSDPLDCNDVDPCTTDSCEPLSGCVNADVPAGGCLTAGTSLLLIKDGADDTRDKLLWKWLKGAAMSQADVADPIADAEYAVCLYAGATDLPIGRAALPAGAGWQALGSKGFKFKGASPDGLSQALLKGGAAGKSKAQVKGAGAALPDPVLPLEYPVTVQLRKDGSSLCLESIFTATAEKKNTAAQFKAKQKLTP